MGVCVWMWMWMWVWMGGCREREITVSMLTGFPSSIRISAIVPD